MVTISELSLLSQQGGQQQSRLVLPILQDQDEAGRFDPKPEEAPRAKDLTDVALLEELQPLGAFGTAVSAVGKGIFGKAIPGLGALIGGAQDVRAMDVEDEAVRRGLVRRSPLETGEGFEISFPGGERQPSKVSTAGFTGSLFDRIGQSFSNKFRFVDPRVSQALAPPSGVPVDSLLARALAPPGSQGSTNDPADSGSQGGPSDAQGGSGQRGDVNRGNIGGA